MGLLSNLNLLLPLITTIGFVCLFRIGLSKLFKHNQKLGLIISFILIIVIILIAKTS